MDTNINIKTSTTMTINIQHQDNQLDDLCFDIWISVLIIYFQI